METFQEVAESQQKKEENKDASAAAGLLEKLSVEGEKKAEDKAVVDEAEVKAEDTPVKSKEEDKPEVEAGKSDSEKKD